MKKYIYIFFHIWSSVDFLTKFYRQRKYKDPLSGSRLCDKVKETRTGQSQNHIRKKGMILLYPFIVSESAKLEFRRNRIALYGNQICPLPDRVFSLYGRISERYRKSPKLLRGPELRYEELKKGYCLISL